MNPFKPTSPETLKPPVFEVITGHLKEISYSIFGMDSAISAKKAEAEAKYGKKQYIANLFMNKFEAVTGKPVLQNIPKSFPAVAETTTKQPSYENAKTILDDDYNEDPHFVDAIANLKNDPSLLPTDDPIEDDLQRMARESRGVIDKLAKDIGAASAELAEASQR